MTQTHLSIDGLHTIQRDIFSSSVRFKILACGRRWGKSRLGMAILFAKAWGGGKCYWISPSYPMSQIAWREMTHRAANIPGVDVKKADLMIIMPTGGWIQLKSADNPNSLRGEGLDYAVLDEAAFMKEEVWTEAIRPALSDKHGGAAFLSTPNGINWFHHLAANAEDDEEWGYWHAKTIDNPYIDEKEIEAARASLPSRVFEQEYEARFIDDSGAIFRNILECCKSIQLSKGIKGKNYVMGVDLGRRIDFTGIIVMDSDDRSVVYVDRFNKIDWKMQISRIKNAANLFDVSAIVCDKTGVGDPVTDEIREETGRYVEGFTFTNASKHQIMEDLALALEKMEISLPIDHHTLNSELLAYQVEKLPSGKLRYNAPDGMHDDLVCALALCLLATNKYGENYCVSW